MTSWLWPNNLLPQQYSVLGKSINVEIIQNLHWNKLVTLTTDKLIKYNKYWLYI
jgi:hypothetical protein